jgi:hypothetical protein
MTPDTLYSIAMIAALALAGGGVWLWRKNGDRRKAVLMIAMSLVLLGNILILAAPV